MDDPQSALPSPKVVLSVALKGLKSDDAEVRLGCLSSIAEVARRVRKFVSDRRSIREFPPANVPPLPPEVQISMKALEPVIPDVTALLKQESGDNVPACAAIEQLAMLRQVMLWGVKKDAANDPFRDPLKKALPGLASVVGSRNVEDRLAALYALEEFESEGGSTAAAVAKALGDSDSDVRWGAARVLGRMAPAGDKEAVPALAKVVMDESVDVRITALAALERYGPAAAGEARAINKALSAKDALTRLWATRAIAAVGTKGREAAVEGLTKALGDEEVRIRRRAAEGLIAFAPYDDPTTKALRKALSDSDDEVRRNASKALLAEKK
jgi:HEAT repeat protein